MSRRPPELFSRDLKFLVAGDRPRPGRRAGSHSHWLATAMITVLVGAWLGGDPSASIDIDNSRRASAASIGPVFGTAPGFATDVDDGRLDITIRDPLDSAPPRSLPDDVFEWADDEYALPGLEFGPHNGTGQLASIPRAIDADRRADDGPVAATTEVPAETTASVQSPLPPYLELETGFEDQQGDIELFSVDTRLDLTAMDTLAGSGWNVFDIKKGDTLSAIFERLGINSEVTHRLIAAEHGKLLNTLQTGPNLRLRFDTGGRLEALRYNTDAVRTLAMELDGDEVAAAIEERAIEVREREAIGRIRSSLFQAGADAGLSDQFMLRLAAIFKWNIDFNRDLQPGDRFSVIFEEKFIDDRKIATGGIVAAAFMIGDKTFTAIRHVETDGSFSYFSADGNSLKRAFLRSPVKFSRISSQFSLKRFHPVLKKWRAHKGVDYAASRGTPVLATADGVVKQAGLNGGYGKAVILQHGRSYSTLYAHLDGFAKNVRKGARVRQGDVIGYVGSSGLATGPHLHYEFRINGEHKNPLTVDVPRALPIAGAEREQFMKIAGTFDRRLASLLN